MVENGNCNRYVHITESSDGQTQTPRRKTGHRLAGRSTKYRLVDFPALVRVSGNWRERKVTASE